MSRSRLIITTVFILLIGFIAAGPAWASVTPATGSPLAVAANATAAVLADMDGDGNLDLIVAEAAAHKIEVFQGNGDGTFNTTAVVTIDSSVLGATATPVALATGLLTGGTLPDLAASEPDGGVVWVFQNTSSGPGNFGLSATSGSPYSLPGANNNPRGLAIADIDCDGNNDVVVADEGPDNVVYLLGDSTAAFTATITSTALTNGTNPVALVIGDFGSAHGGGACTNDIAVVQNATDNVHIMTNTTTTPGTVTFAAVDVSTGASSGPVAIAAGVLKTGPVDLAIANGGSKTVAVLVNNGSGTFSAAAGSPFAIPSSSVPTGIGIGKFLNNDAFNDVAVSAANGLDLFANSGSGGVLTTPATVVAAGTSPSGIATGDLNGDSFADIAIPNNGSSNVSIFLYTPFSNISTIAVSPNPVEGQAYGGPTDLLKFKYDGNPPDTSNFTGTVTWNDGSGGSDSALFTGPDVSNFFTVQGPTHTFPDEGTSTPTILVNNTADSQSVTKNGPTITVDDAPLSDPGTTLDPVASSTTVPFNTGSIVVANFKDGNPGAPTSDYDISTNWGDGNTDNCPHPCAKVGGGVVGPGGITYSVTDSHNYTSAGNFLVSTLITDIGGSTVTINTHVNISTMTVAPVAVAGTEGAQLTNPTILATITTTDPTPNLSAQVDFNCPTAPVGCSLSGTNISVVPITVDGCAAQFCVVTTGTTHTYADEGSFKVYVQVTDTKPPGDGSIGTTTSTATIGDAPLNQIATAGLSNQEGTGLFSNKIVGNFHDANTAAPAGDFTATVDWGDGTATSPGDGHPVVITALGGGDFKIESTHTYANTEETNSYQIKYSVQDVGSPNPGDPGRIGNPELPAPTQNGALVTFTDAPLNNVAATGLSNPEGTGTFSNVIVAKFHDAFLLAPAGDFTATVDWGDGTATSPGDGQAVVITALGGGDFKIESTHTYANTEDTNSYQIKYSVQDVGSPNPGDPGRIGNPELPAPTQNGALVTFADALLTPIAASAGGTQNIAIPAGTLIATFADQFALAPLSDYAQNAPTSGVISVNWGDGNTDVGIGSIVDTTNLACAAEPPPPAGTKLFCVLTGAPHTYTNLGNFTLTVNVKDVGGSTATITGQATVSAGKLTDIPIAQLFPPSNVLQNVQVAHFEDTNPGAVPGDFTATINWGDGNVTNATFQLSPAWQPGIACTESVDLAPCDPTQSQFDVLGSHTYAVANTTFPITGTVTGPGGITTSFSTQVFIPNVAIAQINELISPPSSQIKPGQFVDLLVTFVPTPGVNTPVNLMCTGYDFNLKTTIPLPPGSTCTLDKSTLPDVMQTRQVHALFATTLKVVWQNAPPRPGSQAPYQLALLLPVFFGTFGIVWLTPMSRREKRRTMLGLGIGVMVLALLLVGCGGAGVQTGNTETPPGTYGIAVTTNVPSGNTFVQAVATVNVVQ